MAIKRNTVYGEVLSMDIYNITESIINKIYNALADYQSDIEMSEPETEGFIDRWEEKCDAISELVEEAEALLDIIKESEDYERKDIEEAIEAFQSEVYNYQFDFKGLKGLKI